MAKNFVIAKTAKEAFLLLNEGKAILAGGTEVNRLGSSVVSDTLVSISKIEGLDKIEKCTLDNYEGNFVKIGCMCTFQKAIDSNLVPSYFKDACLFMSSRTKRNMATVGGNVACLRDDSYLWATLIACQAKLEIINNSRTKVIEVVAFLANKEKYAKAFILSVIISARKLNIISKRYANTASSHAYITMSAAKYGKEYCYGLCLKNSGIYVANNEFDISSVKVTDDMFGSKEYKRYLLEVTAHDLKGGLNK